MNAAPTDTSPTPPASIAAKESDASNAPKKPESVSTHFNFANKVFAIPGAYFGLDRTNDEPVLYVSLGEVKAGLTIPILRNAFGIEPESADARLLDVVEKSLKYVKEIRHNDSVPKELLDGTASWSVEPKHRQIAYLRLSMQLVSWMTGKEQVIVDLDQLEQVAEDPTMKQRVQEAFAEMAERLGLGRDKKEEVVGKIEELSRELSYIEALRDRVGMAHSIGKKLDTLKKLYKGERAVVDDIGRMRQLMAKPLQRLDQILLEVDGQTGEIMAVLKNIQSSIKYIRDMRDQLHIDMMKWGETLGEWSSHVAEPSRETEQLMRRTYQFLARYFMVGKVWKQPGT
jgi:uncharacterized coiled-coil DUF342 family protein